MVLRWFQMAAASWERAEFAVHTNTTRGPVGRLWAIAAGDGGRPDGRLVKL